MEGRYRLEREFGAGGMATVYLAHDLKHDRQVAIKVLREDLSASLGKERFLREIRIAAALQHPHILPLYDSGEAAGFLYYVMPFVDGQKIYTLNPPALPNGAVYNVGQVHGGEFFNGIPQELYFTMDLRSPDPVLLDSLDRTINAIVAEAAKAEGVEWRREVVQRNGAGGTEEMLKERRRHPLVETAIDVHRFVGIDLPQGREAVATGSTDANVGVVRGIPSISIGRSFGGNQHTLSEWADWPSARRATKMVLLPATSLAGLSGSAIVP